MVGMTPGECFDRKCYEIFETEICGTDQCTCQVAIKGDTVNNGSTTMRIHGNEIPIEYASRPLKNHEGRIIGCVEHFTDISDRIAREALIVRQQQELLQQKTENIRTLQNEILELSTPVIELWDGVLALPLIGTLDSNRARNAMEKLLETIEKTRSPFVIIDITGVPTVDTEVANHLLHTVDAVRLMGSETILSGISTHIALTMAHLGIDMGSISVTSRMSDALHMAIARLQQRKKHSELIETMIKNDV
jgi:anti-anti-sigma regulatory factor